MFSIVIVKQKFYKENILRKHMRNDIYTKNILKLICYVILFILLININSFMSRDFFIELDGINYILVLLCVPCAFLYYTLCKHKSKYIYILIYASILMEYIITVTLLTNNIATNAKLFTPFIFRTLLLILILHGKDNIIDYIVSQRAIIFIIWIFTTLISISFDYFVDFAFKRNLIYFTLYCIFIFYSYYIIYKLLIKSIKTKDFVQTIYILNLALLNIGIVFNSIRFFYSKNFYSFMVLDKLLFSVAFSILVIGVFIQSKYLLIENTKLVHDMENISHIVEESKVTEKLRIQFFANMSHEFKTPLNIIFSSIQLLDSKNKESYESIGRSYLKYSKTIKQNCYRMIRLVNNIVDMTKIDSGYTNINFQNHDIVYLVENIVTSIVPYLEKKNLNIIFDTTVEELIIKCDSDSIIRILLNLISNSIKFSNPNGLILVDIDSNSEFVTIKIKDDGIGIEEEKREAIFSIFVQSDKSLTRQKEGSGIGLSLAKSLVEGHGGNISLNSKLENGTEIIIKLPNIKLEDDDTKLYTTDIDQNNLISKINIEFSDIYDLY